LRLMKKEKECCEKVTVFSCGLSFIPLSTSNYQ